MRIAILSPFVDRCHGTERALAELLERLVRNHACEIHLYAQNVADLAVSPFRQGFRRFPCLRGVASCSQNSGPAPPTISLLDHRQPIVPAAR